MERHPRRPDTLCISAELSTTLAALRRLEGVENSAELDVDRVRDIEGTVGCRLPDGILALAAASVPSLQRNHRVELGSIPELSALGREAGFRGDFIAFAVDSGSRKLHGFVKGSAAEDTLTIDRDTKGSTTGTLTQWLLARFPRAREVAPPSAFEPRLVRHAPTVDAPGPQARHPRWGVGTVMAEDGHGPQRKIKIAFPGHGLKVVQARFLEFLADE